MCSRTFLCAIAIVLSTASPFVAQAQFSTDAGSDSPWADMKLPKTKIKLEFRNATVDNVLSLYQKVTGVTIIKDPTLTGTLTISSAKPVKLSDALEILSTTLSLKGFTMTRQGEMLVIRNRNSRTASQSSNPMGGGPGGTQFSSGGMAFGGNSGGNAQSTSVLRMYTLKYAGATQVAKVLNDVFQQTGTGALSFGGMMGGPGGGGPRGGGPGGGGPGGMVNMNQNSGQARANSLKASADEYSNSVIVNAPEADQSQIRSIITQLDKEVSQPLVSELFKLQYASSSDLVTVIQGLLSANTPKGKGSTASSSTQSNFPPFMNNSSSSSTTNQAIADTRTNSLLVTATEANMALVKRMITQLDTFTAAESTTFVFQLSNAKASDIATLMKQAFGTRSGSSTSNSSTTISGRVSNSTSSNSSSSSSRSSNSGLNGETQGNDLVVDLQDPNADSGALRTQVGVVQGFGGGGFGGGGFGQSGGSTSSSSSKTTQTTGRDSSGKLVNTRDLTGQVTAIADPNTNSIIVVTSPEYAALIRGIIEQLDKIPEQVMIETMIVEASLDSSNKLGVEWNLSSSLSRALGDKTATGSGGANYGLSTATDIQGFKYTVTGAALSSFVNLLKTDQRYQVLSTPKIFTSNMVEAEINISQSIPYVLSSRQDTNGNYTYNYSFQDVGVVLTVTPRITSNGFVTMDVTQTANDLQGYTSFNAPIVNQREAQTTVSVKDGETIVLGGIIRKTVSSTVKKIPLLGDLPVLGNIFRQSSKENTKTELLVFLTPHVVRNSEEARALRENEEKKLEPSTIEPKAKQIKQIDKKG